MFGLKIVKKIDYDALAEELHTTKQLLTNSVNDNIKLKNENKILSIKVDNLSKEIEKLSHTAPDTKQQDVVLLTDVATSPLTEKVKSNKKNTMKKTIRKKVVE